VPALLGVRSHQAAGRARVIPEQGADAPTLGRRQQRHNVLASLLRQVVDQVGRIVDLHPREHRRSLLVRHVGFALGVDADGLEDLLAFAVRGRLDEIGELRGVQLCELRVRNPQPYRRHVPVNGSTHLPS
jgi:hypothetical protein